MPKRVKHISIDEQLTEVDELELQKIRTWIMRRKKDNDLNRKTILQLKWLELHDKSGQQ